MFVEVACVFCNLSPTTLSGDGIGVVEVVRVEVHRTVFGKSEFIVVWALFVHVWVGVVVSPVRVQPSGVLEMICRPSVLYVCSWR